MPRLSDRGCADRWRGTVRRRGRRDGVPVIQRGGDGLFTQPVHGDGSDDLRVLAADLLPGAC